MIVRLGNFSIKNSTFWGELYLKSSKFIMKQIQFDPHLIKEDLSIF